MQYSFFWRLLRAKPFKDRPLKPFKKISQTLQKLKAKSFLLKPFKNWKGKKCSISFTVASIWKRASKLFRPSTWRNSRFGRRRRNVIWPSDSDLFRHRLQREKWKTLNQGKTWVRFRFSASDGGNTEDLLRFLFFLYFLLSFSVQLFPILVSFLKSNYWLKLEFHARFESGRTRAVLLSSDGPTSHSASSWCC